MQRTLVQHLSILDAGRNSFLGSPAVRHGRRAGSLHERCVLHGLDRGSTEKVPVRSYNDHEEYEHKEEKTEEADDEQEVKLLQLYRL